MAATSSAASRAGVVKGAVIEVGHRPADDVRRQRRHIGQRERLAVEQRQQALARAGHVPLHQAALGLAVEAGVEYQTLETVQAEIVQQLLELLAARRAELDEGGRRPRRRGRSVSNLSKLLTRLNSGLASRRGSPFLSLGPCRRLSTSSGLSGPRATTRVILPSCHHVT